MPTCDPTRFLVSTTPPCYLEPTVLSSLDARRMSALSSLNECSACPRDCGANRAKNKLGHCRTGRFARVAAAFPHFGEEHCLRGRHGSGTIFFAECNLHCVFCQNADISHNPACGVEVDAEQLGRLMLDLQAQGCHNINFVTPSHVVPQIIEALQSAVRGGLRIPLVYNSGGYDSVETLRRLDGLVDIYMPDFKFWTAETAGRLADVQDYPDRARDAILEMHRQVGDLRFDEQGVARRGLLVRQLVMPGLLVESRRIYEWLATDVSPDTFVNIMGQYRPEHRVCAANFPGICRRPTSEEMRAAYAAARSAGLWRLDKAE